MNTKTCRDCGVEKPTCDYYSHPKTHDKLLPQCKECHKAGVRANRKRRIEYYRAYDVMRFQRDSHRRAAQQKRSSKRRKEVPGMMMSHNAVARAVRSGKLIRQPCEVCGRKDTHGHHDDYSKPLEVRWLCPPHHREVHGGKHY